MEIFTIKDKLLIYKREYIEYPAVCVKNTATPKIIKTRLIFSEMNDMSERKRAKASERTNE